MRKGTVLISGKFAVIHSGHIRLFMYARSIGQEVIVAIDSNGLSKDELEWRLNFLKTQQFVDSVIQYEEDIEGVLYEIEPEFVLKGSEFATTYNKEVEIVSKYGGEVIFSSGSTYFLESDLISKKKHLNKGLSIEIPHEYLRRNNLKLQEIRECILSFKQIRVCVIGDLIIDEFINCHPLGMSREEPTVVVTPIDSQKFLGGAGIVAAHTAGLGAITTLVTIVGEDDSAKWATEKVRDYGLSLLSIKDNKRPTTLKQRFRSGSHTLLKISHLSQDEVSTDIQERIVQTFEKISAGVDLLILSDFSYGVFSNRVAERLIEIAKRNKVVVAADSQTSSQLGNLSQFKGSDLITPTETEARLELKDQHGGLAVVIEKLRHLISSKCVILKLGSDGVLINGKSSHGEPMRMDALPAFNQNPIDASGAGDSLLSAAALSLAVDTNLYKAALIGSVAASIQVSRLGNVPIKQEDLLQILQK